MAIPERLYFPLTKHYLKFMYKNQVENLFNEKKKIISNKYSENKTKKKIFDYIRLIQFKSIYIFTY